MRSPCILVCCARNSLCSVLSVGPATIVPLLLIPNTPMYSKFDENLLAKFEESLVRTGLAATTVVNYMADLRSFARWLAHRPSPNGGLLGVQTEDIQSYQENMGGEGRTSSTINRRVHAIRKFYEFVLVEEWMVTNPARDVSCLSRPERSAPRALTNSETQAFLETIRTTARSSLIKRDYAMVVLLLGTGVRVSELVELQLDDVEFIGEAGYLLVGHHRRDGGRYIPLSAAVCEALKEYVEVRPRSPGAQCFFLSQGGRPLSPRRVQGLVQRYAQTTGLKGVTAQVLRDTFALTMLTATEDVALVAEFLGHRRVETTVQRYLRSGIVDAKS
jgi:site-specific recombinase XerD